MKTKTAIFGLKSQRLAPIFDSNFKTVKEYSNQEQAQRGLFLCLSGEFSFKPSSPGAAEIYLPKRTRQSLIISVQQLLLDVIVS